MKSVIIDTNFLLVPHQFGINIIEQLERLIEVPHEMVVSSAIIHELNGIAKNRGKTGAAARVALQAVEKKKIRCIESQEKDADTWIMVYCSENPGTIVCTNDVELKHKLKGLTVRIVVMRNRARISWG